MPAEVARRRFLSWSPLWTLSGHRDPLFEEQ